MAEKPNDDKPTEEDFKHLEELMKILEIKEEAPSLGFEHFESCVKIIKAYKLKVDKLNAKIDTIKRGYVKSPKEGVFVYEYAGTKTTIGVN